LNEIEAVAKRELQKHDYVAIYLMLHGPPTKPRNATPGMVCNKRVGGHMVELLWPGWEDRSSDRTAWCTEVAKQARNAEIDIKHRKRLIAWLGEEAVAVKIARRTLTELLVHDPLPAVRAECAAALEDTAAADQTVVRQLLERLDKDESDLVRG